MLTRTTGVFSRVFLHARGTGIWTYLDRRTQMARASDHYLISHKLAPLILRTAFVAINISTRAIVSRAPNCVGIYTADLHVDF